MNKKLLGIIALAIAMPLTTLLSFADDAPVESLNIKQTKIIGGVKSAPTAWPSTVALLHVDIADQQNDYQAQFCGGSLIASKWVLTAAHCVVDNNTGAVLSASSLYALVGTNNLIYYGQRMTVKRIVVHPDYDHNTDDSDLALLELDYETGVTPIPISVNDAPPNLLTTVVGWGKLDNGDFPIDLHEVEVPIVDQSTCESTYDTDYTQNMICAGYVDGGKDTCQSDSGGPLMGIQHGKYVQIGVTSWGVGCAQPELYGVYTRLSQFEGWIQSYTGNSSYPSGEYSSWSKFYTPPSSSSGGNIYGLLPFLLLIVIGRIIRRRSISLEGL